MSDKIQDELSGICWRAACNSLDAERKIAQDKKNETVKTTGLPRASRNGILQRYRLQKDAAMEMGAVARKTAEKDKFMNLRAVAIRRNPDLRPQGGRLFGESEVDMAERRQVGDGAALQAYIEANRESLAAEAAAIRQVAKTVLANNVSSGDVPMSNTQWLEWLEAHDAEFRENLKSATRLRRSLAARLQTEDLPAASRIQAAERVSGDLPVWCQVLGQQDSGIFALVPGGGRSQKIVFFASSLYGCPWITILQPHAPQVFSFEIARSFHDHFRPAQEVVDSMGVRVADEAWSLHRIDARCVGLAWPAQSHLHFEVKGVSPPLDKTPRRCAAPNQTQEEDDDLCSVASSDACSLASDVDSAAEQDRPSKFCLYTN
jgi:hypothetical protein